MQRLVNLQQNHPFTIQLLIGRISFHHSPQIDMSDMSVLPYEEAKMRLPSIIDEPAVSNAPLQQNQTAYWTLHMSLNITRSLLRIAIVSGSNLLVIICLDLKPNECV